LPVYLLTIELDNKIYRMQHYSGLHGDEIHRLTRKMV